MTKRRTQSDIAAGVGFMLLIIAAFIFRHEIAGLLAAFGS